VRAARLALCAAVAAVWLPLSSAQSAAPARRPHFTDVAARSEFTYNTNNHFTGRKYFPQPMCSGVAILDFDNDGKMDIYLTNGASLPELKKNGPSFYHCLLRNRGRGTFADVTAAAGLTGANLDSSYGVAAGDFDNDGHTDLFVCNTGRNTLYRNCGDGTFADTTVRL
jgi:hypothetical protein